MEILSYITEMVSYIDCVCSQMDPLELLRLGWMWKYFHISSKVGLARWEPWIYGNPCRGIKNLAMGEYKSRCSLRWKKQDQILRFRFSSRGETKFPEERPNWQNLVLLEMTGNDWKCHRMLVNYHYSCTACWTVEQRWIILQQFWAFFPHSTKSS